VAAIRAKLAEQASGEAEGPRTLALTNIALNSLPADMTREEYTRQQLAKPSRVHPAADVEAGGHTKPSKNTG